MKQVSVAERGQVAHDIAGAAQHRDLALDSDHRDRRLGRDAIDMAVDKAIEHQVADAQHPRLGELANRRDEIGGSGHDVIYTKAGWRVYS
ncbi:MAG: hypothetical protein WDO24_19605 [Pseudomonadota bacterium]